MVLGAGVRLRFGARLCFDKKQSTGSESPAGTNAPRLNHAQYKSCTLPVFCHCAFCPTLSTMDASPAAASAAASTADAAVVPALPPVHLFSGGKLHTFTKRVFMHFGCPVSVAARQVSRLSWHMQSWISGITRRAGGHSTIFDCC